MFQHLRAFSAVAALLSACLGFGSAAYAAPGDLLVSPVRVIFEGRTRVAEVTLVNKGDETSVYRISFENRRMKEDGTFEEVEEARAGELFSETLVRYAPRRVELQPNAPQTLRLMLRKPPSLEDGEYRSHLYFAAVPQENGVSGLEESETDNISIELTPIYGVTIPIIVRHGELDANVEIGELSSATTQSGAYELNLQMSRTGDRSVYGDISVRLPGSPHALAEKRGVAIYSPNQSRKVAFQVPADVAETISGRSFEITFTERDSPNAGAISSATFGPTSF